MESRSTARRADLPAAIRARHAPGHTFRPARSHRLRFPSESPCLLPGVTTLVPAVRPPHQRHSTNRHPHTTRERYRRTMKVWIDQDLCTGDGLCEEIAPDVFTLLDDGLAYVKEGSKIFATAKGNPQGADGMAEIPDGQLDGVIESAEECPGECIFIEP